jgi:type II secretory pathway pseudopilin PulG
VGNFVFWFVAVAAIIGLLIGIFIGSITRGARARRKEQRLSQQLNECQEALKAANDPARLPQPPAPRPPRWTASEIAKVVGASATLLGGIAGLYAAYNGHQVKDLQAELDHASRQVQDSNTKIGQILGLAPEEWGNVRIASQSKSFPNKGRGHADFPIDGLHLRGDCNPKKLVLTFGLVASSVLHCDAGSAVIRLGGSSRLLILPDTSQP